MKTVESPTAMTANAAPASSTLKGRAWQRFLRGPDPVLLEELYVPALAEAVRYDRCCSYFSSSVLAAAARGFGRLIERLIALGESTPRPAVRLIVNEELEADDVRAMTETGDTSPLEAALTKRFRNPKDILEKRRLAMLGWMVKSGLLDVRVGVMRHGTGIVHAKFGVMVDETGNAVVFSGSGNESARGLRANYEEIEVSTSWEDATRHAYFRDRFDKLWQDKDGDVHTVTLPEALRLKLIKFAPKQPPTDEPANALARQKAAMIWQFIVESPYLPNGEAACDATVPVDSWPHQRHVVEETAAAWPDGRLLCDEVGMGKTIEAILILRRLMAGRGVRRALLLLPKNLLEQWQAELREKGGMIFPRLEGLNTLVWPDGTTERVDSLADALKQDVLLVSRETARTERNTQIVLAAEPWDLVLLDEAHAARRAKQVEGEFNSGHLLLELLRRLQLERRTRSMLLLSATPMQTHPWEPWDLLSVLGEGGAWLAEFSGVRDYYAAVAALRNGQCSLATARKVAAVISADAEFPQDVAVGPPDLTDADAVARKIAFCPVSQRPLLAAWLRQGSPLTRRMHRNTRRKLRQYHELGLLPSRPPQRRVEDVSFDYDDPRERAVYDAVTRYIEKRFEELEGEKPGKGFVMTVYRQRASSSPQALRRSLERRRSGLQAVASRRAFDQVLGRDDVPEAVTDDDLPESEAAVEVSAAFPVNPDTARAELVEVDQLLDDLRALGALDSKRDRFFSLLRRVTDDGRTALVFTEYTDTLEYLRDALVDHYGERLGCYSGAGGRIWDGAAWKPVTKDAITKKLHAGELAAVICTDAASEGLNLQAAGALVNYDLPWNPSKVEQRIGRIDRIGQKYTTIWIVNLFLKNSVDERVYRVLRQRCHLFEHFVGPMQPVLSRARKLLMAGSDVNLGELETAAQEVEQDPLAEETYIESAAAVPSGPAAPLKLGDLEQACLMLDGSFGPKCRRLKDGTVFELSVPGSRKLRLSAAVESLEADRRLQPLSPTTPAVRSLADKLLRPGERLPLVIAASTQRAFRAVVAYWVDDDSLIPVESVDQLRKQVERWNGDYPLSERWQEAKRSAEKDAVSLVCERIDRVRAREEWAVRQQTAAARLRLERELGRYLVCVSGTTDDLNQTFHEQMIRDSAGARRLRRCYDSLGGYPEWPPDLREGLTCFFSGLTENQRQARLFGSELDAALSDPRWKART